MLALRLPVQLRIRAVVAICFLMTCIPGYAVADFLPIVSYSMLNGESGSQTYYDDTYGGLGAIGNPNASGSFLSGGLGQLRNSLFAAPADILDDEWVGWNSIQPQITLDLGATQVVNSLGIHASNWSEPFNDVGVPGSASLSYSLDNIAFTSLGTYSTTDADRSGDVPRWVDLPFNGVPARYIRAQLFDGTKFSGTIPGLKQWIFIDEIRAEGIASVPEPGSTTLVVLGVLAVAARSGFVRRKRHISGETAPFAAQ